jgi:hypothetical protein
LRPRSKAWTGSAWHPPPRAPSGIFPCVEIRGAVFAARAVRRSGAGGGQGAAVLGLTADFAVEFRRIAELDRGLAIRRAGVGFAFEAALDRDHGRLRRLHADRGFRQHLPGGIEGDQVGAAEALPGEDQDAVSLKGDVGDHRISNDDGRGLLRQAHDLGVVDGDRHDGGRRVRGLSTHRPATEDGIP